MRIDFVRHGKPEDDKEKGRIYSHRANLSPEGHRQAEGLAQEYRRRGTVFDEVYSSPLPRARQTAEHLPRKRKRIRIRRDLAEPNLGDLVGQRFDDLRNAEGEVDLYAVPHKGQEPFQKTDQRARRGVKQIIHETQPDKTVAVVSHGLIGKSGMDYVRNPNGPLPNTEHDLRKSDQLGNAEANSMILDKSGKVIREERINGNS